MHPANQRPRKPDKLSQGVHKQTGYPRVQWQNKLDKREATDPKRVMKTTRRDTETEGNVGQGTIRNIGLPMLQEARNKA